ncbi:MAG: hypothetical protein FJZ96_08980 [Chloroflexi bacterium]|nr:hypothetical protein [Chloroflexota bacterium]
MPAKKRIFLLILSLSLATLACTIFIGGPDYPDQTIPVSTEAVEQMQQSIKEAMAAGAVSGQVTLVINEAQLTSYLAFKLETQPDPFITKPQIYLRDGQIQVYGTASSGYFSATVRLVLTATADEGGELLIEMTEADFGPLPAPEGLKEAVTTLVSEAYTGAVGPVATGLRIESIVIADGLMTVVGRIK